MNGWVPEQIKPEGSLPEAVLTSHIIRRQGALEKTMMWGKVEGHKERGRLNAR